MATQDDTGIPIASAPDGKGYRLFELPPELESLLEAPNAPVLYLSHPDSSPTALVSVDGGNTYAMHQKNTSNTLLLLAPTSAAQPPPELDADDSAAVPSGRLTALATLHETFELVPKPSTIEQKVNRGKWHERFGRHR